MSVSSGSDITIPIQDSPPPPPSPFASANKKGTNNGIDNAGFESCENEKKQTSKEKNHTQVQMNGSDQPPVLNEALNSELINMNIMNTIPDKPNPEFGPYENPDEYFIAVNQHKKFLRRSEKLYVTKDKRKVNPWRKYMCYLIGAVAVATVITVAIGVGLISQKSTTTSTYSENILGTTSSSSAELISSSSGPISSTSSEIDDWISGSASTTSSSSSSSSSASDGYPSSIATRPPLSENYVPAAADVTITLENVEYTAALNNKSSDKFHELASEIEREMRNKLRDEAGLNAYAKVMEFLPGSIVVKMRLSWVDEQKDLMEVQMFMSTLRTLGQYELRHGATSSYGLVNHCKFGNYGCSHYCAFDYEQLDFLCTCPENLRLSEDKKLCVENTTFSTTEMDISSLKPELNVTDEPEQMIVQQSPSEETVTDEPMVIPESVSTQSSSHHEHMPVSPTTTTTSTAQPSDVETAGVHVTTEGGSMINETVGTSEETHQTSVRDSELGFTDEEEEGRSNSSPEIPLAETTTMYPSSEDDQEQININSTSHSGVTHEDIKASTENEPIEIPSLAHDDNNKTDTIDVDIDAPVTESPVEMTTMTLLPASDEEEGISNEALLQRTGSDNYSEVEQQQLNARLNTATTTTSTTTTVPTPIISFNSSRYSEENNNNTSNILSSQSNESNLDRVEQQQQEGEVEEEEGTTNASDAELLSLEGNNNATNGNDTLINGTSIRSKSARFEKFGENFEQQQQQQSLNVSSRRILSNSAEFMVYGDNVLGANGNTRESSEGGTDSGLTEQGSFYPHHVLGRFNLNGTDPEAESGQTERSGESSATESDATSGSVEIDDTISHSVEEPIPAGLIRSDSTKNKVEEAPQMREIEETTTIIPINLENDTLVNENATEDRTNVEPVNEDVIIIDNNSSDDVVVPTTPSTTQALDERIVAFEDSPINSSEIAVPITEIPKVSESDISNDNEGQAENDNPQSRNDNSDAPTVTERQSNNNDEEVVVEVTEPNVVNQDENEDDLTTTTPISPQSTTTASTNSSVTTTSTTPEPVIQQENSNSNSQNDDNSQQSSNENTTISQNEGVTTPTTTAETTTTTTTVKPNNSLNLNNSNSTNTSSSSSSNSQTTVDNENELS